MGKGDGRCYCDDSGNDDDAMMVVGVICMILEICIQIEFSIW